MKASARYPNGITKYTACSYTEVVYFPYTDVCCDNCRKLAKNEAGQLYCRITRQILYRETIKEGVGDRCPLELEEVEE